LADPVRAIQQRCLAASERLQGIDWLRVSVDFLRYVAERFRRDACLQNAATLSYTTLLALVPLLTIGFSMFAAFPVFSGLTGQLQDLLFQNLVPASTEVVQQHLQSFVDRAAGLTVVGLIALVVSALLMMAAIDRAMNDIWRVQQRRRPLQGFMVYWTVLTLAPILMGASLGVSSYVVSMASFGDIDALSGVRGGLLAAMPFVAETLAFTFLYAAVPNHRVPVRHALLGGVLAAVLFEIAKGGFGWYVRNIPTYEAIYGALAALPIFLIWIYLSWIVVLVGAEFTQALGSYSLARHRAAGTGRDAFRLAVHVLGHLWNAQRDGRGLSTRALARLEPEAGEMGVLEVLRPLRRARAIQLNGDGDWILARDPSHYTLLDLYRSETFPLPSVAALRKDGDDWDQRLADTLEQADTGLAEGLAESLDDIFTTRPQIRSVVRQANSPSEEQ